jgi:hypothetical protein
MTIWWKLGPITNLLGCFFIVVYHQLSKYYFITIVPIGKNGSNQVMGPLQTHPCNENRVFPV